MNVILTNLPQIGNLVGNLYGCYHIRCYMINVEVKKYNFVTRIARVEFITRISHTVKKTDVL